MDMFHSYPLTIQHSHSNGEAVSFPIQHGHFQCYLNLPEGKSHETTINIPLNHHFPMVKGQNSLAVNPRRNFPAVPRAYREITWKAMENRAEIHDFHWSCPANCGIFATFSEGK